jgi:HEAT repeat protein
MAHLKCIKNSGGSRFAGIAMSGLCITFLLTGIAMVLAATSTQVPTDADRVASAFKLLWSPDENERRAAKQELIQIGDPTIPPLLSLLEDIFRNPNKFYFATGKEMEGAEAMRLWEDGVTTEDLSNLEIGWRLRDDCYELLGRLRAIEAVPLLLRIMERQDIFTGFSTLSAEMRVMVEIGPPAVPNLIEAMEKAKERAASIGFGGPQPTEEEKERIITSEAAKFRARVAMVLGEIGDERALPVLEKFLERSDELGLRRLDIQFIEKAIRQIKGGNRAN